MYDKTKFLRTAGDGMLQIKNLTITLKKDLRTILKDFSFVLHAGDKAVVVGEEGNGKSTLVKLIAAPDLAESYVEYTGEIITRGAREVGTDEDSVVSRQRQIHNGRDGARHRRAFGRAEGKAFVYQNDP